MLPLSAMTDPNCDLWNWVELSVTVEQLDGRPSRTELRYFDPRQRNVATALRRQADLPPSEVALRDFSTDYDTIPNHFELWLSP